MSGISNKRMESFNFLPETNWQKFTLNPRMLLKLLLTNFMSGSKFNSISEIEITYWNVGEMKMQDCAVYRSGSG